MVRDSSYFYDYVGLESEGTTIDFQIGANSYLYGTRFISYLAYMHGPESVLNWVNRSSRRVVPLDRLGARLAGGQPGICPGIPAHALPEGGHRAAWLGLTRVL